MSFGLFPLARRCTIFIMLVMDSKAWVDIHQVGVSKENQYIEKMIYQSKNMELEREIVNLEVHHIQQCSCLEHIYAFFATQ